MNKLFKTGNSFNLSSKTLLGIFLLVVVLSCIEIIYYSNHSNKNKLLEYKKIKAVSFIQLPDLALVTEAVWLRHRSLSNVFSIFPEDGTLLDYYPSSFIYNIDIKQPQNNQNE